MNLTRCSQGHFYDAETYSVCPHCNGASDSAFDETHTIALDSLGETEPITGQFIDSSYNGGGMSDTTVSLSQAIMDTTVAVEEEASTVGYFEQEMEISSPVVGWLVCVAGSKRAQLGRDYRLVEGKNSIGRGANFSVNIEGDDSVSRQAQAYVIYDPKGNCFIVQIGESKSLCYLNGKVVLSPVELKLGDIITVGGTDLRFVPLCTDSFNWSSIDMTKYEEKK